MSSNIIPFSGITKLDMPVEQVLEQAKKKVDSGGVIVLGWDDDEELYFASSIADGGEVLWLLEKAKLALMEMDT